MATTDSYRLKGNKEDLVWPGYDSVKKWTKGKDIFESDIIVIPINES